MIIYCFIILFATFIYYLATHNSDKKSKNVFYLLSILFPSIISAIRYGIGTDYFTAYYPYFLELKSGALSYRMRNFELGYSLINRIVIFIGGEFNMVLFICAFITFYYLIKSLNCYKNKINVTLAFFLYMLLYFQKSFNLVRQMMSLSIILYALTTLNSGKNKKYIIYVIFASLFQRTSMIMLIIPFVKKIYQNKEKRGIRIISYIILLMFILNFKLIGNFLINIGGGSLEYYSYYFLEKDGIGISINYFIRFFPLLISSLFFLKHIRNDKEMSLYFSLYIIGTILSLLGYFTSTYGERIALYFLIVQVIFIPYVIRLSFNYKIIFSKFLIPIVLVGLNVFLWYNDYIYLGREQTIPYTTIFSDTIY